jgi:hypothetical protein
MGRPRKHLELAMFSKDNSWVAVLARALLEILMAACIRVSKQWDGLMVPS